MKTSFLAFFTGLLLAGTAVHSQADILVNSDFDAGYTPGNLVGQSGTNDVGFSGTYGASSDAGATLNVVSGGLSYNNGSVSIPGGSQSLQVNSTTGGVVTVGTRALAGGITAPGTTFYERVVFSTGSSANAVGGQGSYADFGVGITQGNNLNFNRTDNVGFQASSTNQGQYGPISDFGSNVADFYTGAFADSQVSPSTSAGTTHLLVAEFVYNGDAGNPKYGTVNFFLDPTSSTEGTPIATASTDSYSNFDTFALSIANLAGTVQIDSFAIGTSFADVVTSVPEPSTWMASALLLLGAMPLVLRKRLA